MFVDLHNCRENHFLAVTWSRCLVFGGQPAWLVSAMSGGPHPCGGADVSLENQGACLWSPHSNGSLEESFQKLSLVLYH